MNSIDKIRENAATADRLLNEIRDIAATQCLNCGLAYDNGWRTHRTRFFGNPKCAYRPAGENRLPNVAPVRGNPAVVERGETPDQADESLTNSTRHATLPRTIRHNSDQENHADE